MKDFVIPFSRFNAKFSKYRTFTYSTHEVVSGNLDSNKACFLAFFNNQFTHMETSHLVHLINVPIFYLLMKLYQFQKSSPTHLMGSLA